MSTLGTNIRYLRKKHNYSQDKLAELLGYKSFTTIQKWESGVAEPPFKTLAKLAELFHVDMDDLAKKDLSVEESPAYYLDPGAAELAKELYTRPEMRVLFDASRNATAEDVQMAAELLDRLSKK